MYQSLLSSFSAEVHTAKQTHNKGAYRRNGVLHSQHVDVFNSNGEAYENAWDLPPAAETVVAVTRAVEEEGRDVHAGVLRACGTEIVKYSCRIFCELSIHF